jgi:hypothetical protein
VDDNPEKTTKADIADGLEKILDGWTDKEVGFLSKHFSGEAFDVQPVTENAEAIKKAIKELPGVKKFLEKEAGLERWHAQF